MNYHFTVIGNDFARAGSASAEIKKILQRLGIAQSIIKRTAVAMYEAEINMVVHAGGGEAQVTIEDDAITIEMVDQGPGIPDIEIAMQDGWSSAPDKVRQLGFGAGMGLPNMKRNSDEFSIVSSPGEGTRVTMKIKVE